MEKIIELVKKTGDTFVVVDQNGQPNYVVLNFDSYERLVDKKPELADLTEQELLEKINRDVASWKDSQIDNRTGDWQSIHSVLQDTKFKAETQSKGQENQPDLSINNQENTVNQAENIDNKDQYYFEPIE